MELASAITAQKKAQEESDIVLGKAPAKIQLVTDALNKQVLAQQALQELTASIPVLKDDLAASDEKIAKLKSEGPAVQQEKIDQLTASLHDAQTGKAEADAKLANAKVGRSDATDSIEQQLRDRRAKAEQEIADVAPGQGSQERKNAIATAANREQVVLEAELAKDRKSVV